MMLKTPKTPGGMEGEGKLVQKVLIAEDVYAPDFDANEEMYISILTDRETNKNIIIYSTEGGMDIEAVAEKTPEKVHKEIVDPAQGLLPFQSRKIAFNLGLEGKAFKEMTRFIASLYKAYTETDASLFEINPCLKTGDDRILAVDAKVTIDDNALYRQTEIVDIHVLSEEVPSDDVAHNYGERYVKLV